MPSRGDSVGTTLEELVMANPKRVSLTIFNTHASNTLYFKEGREVSATNGIPVYSGGNVGITLRDDGEYVKERFVIIADGASTTYVVVEGLIR